MDFQFSKQNKNSRSSLGLMSMESAALAASRVSVKKKKQKKKKRIDMTDPEVLWTGTGLSRFQDRNLDIYISRYYKSCLAVRISSS